MINVTNTPLEEIFGYNTKQSELIDACKYIKETFIRPKYSSIPKEYYPFLYKLLSYRKFDYHDAHTHLRVTSKYANLSKEKYKPDLDLLKSNGYYKELYDKEKLNK